MAKISKLGFVLYTVGLIFVWLVVIATSAESTTALEKPLPPLSTPGTWRSGGPSVERRNERNCKALCEHCGCLGFYCGEECLCECNNDNSDTECIGTMQSNARKLDIPFEILIQGPTCNRFVRNALQFEQNSERRSCTAANAGRNKRSTVTIYKPLRSKQSASPLVNALDATGKSGIKHGERNKRAVEHIAWFNDLASNLVRPAPFMGRGRKTTTPEPEPVVQKRQQTKPFDFSWYTEPNPQKLVQPAPIHKRPYSTPKAKRPRQSGKQVSEKERRPLNFETDDMLRAAMEAVESFPRVIQDSIANKQPAERERERRPSVFETDDVLKAAMDAVERFPRVFQDSMSGIADRNNDDLYKFNFMNAADILPNPLNGKDFTDILRRLRQETVAANEITTTKPPRTTTEAPPAQPPQGIFLPWLRNRMWLRRRLQDRLNNLL